MMSASGKDMAMEDLAAMDTCSSRPINVLLVEDDPVFAAVISLKLDTVAAGAVRLTHVLSLADATRLLSGKGTDLVLLDLHLPDAAGLEAVAAVRRMVPEVAIVVMTARDDDDIALRALELGAQEYLVKGQDKERQILRAIRFAVERNRIAHRLRVSEQRFHDFAAMAAEWFWEIAPDLCLAWVSDGVRRVLGCDPEAVIGHRLGDVLGCAELNALLLRDQPYAPVSLQIERPDSAAVLCLSGRAVFAPSGDFLGFRGVCGARA
jgi:CheY-like chemotaxis protein